jgi:hypothetical protein
MFNREYQKRATRQGIRSFLAQEFYRPAKLPDPRPRRVKQAGPEQLELKFDGPQPLEDIFPSACVSPSQRASAPDRTRSPDAAGNV